MTQQTHASWQSAGLEALKSVDAERLPGFEILYLDELAVMLLGPSPLAAPYTVEDGTKVVGALLRSLANAAYYQPAPAPAQTPAIAAARQQVLAGSHAFATRRLPGLNQLVQRVVGAVVGELEVNKDAPVHQVRSLFTYGLLALASGPHNLLAAEPGDGCAELFQAWDRLIGDGFVPPWRATDTRTSGPKQTRVSDRP